ncbi:uncharacterized protein LOC136072646 isoform X3 [Hydra vulgaris]|uniref:Uncharacterized protein LOC136072646 isoform X3 n=1 Tax=Hydra vulgaris TaxID=6087 RepID=A0ABM4DAE0_HYDVU
MSNEIESCTSGKEDINKNEKLENNGFLKLEKNGFLKLEKNGFLKGISFRKSPKNKKLSSKNEKISKNKNLFKSLFRNKIKISDNAELNEKDKREDIQSALQDAKMSFDSGINMFTNVKKKFQATKEKSTKAKQSYWNLFFSCYGTNKKIKNTETQFRFYGNKEPNGFIESKKVSLSDDSLCLSSSFDEIVNYSMSELDEGESIHSTLQNIENKIETQNTELNNLVPDNNNYISIDDQSSITLNNVDKELISQLSDNGSLFSNLQNADNSNETSFNLLFVFSKLIANLKKVQKRVHLFRSSRRIHPIAFDVKDAEASQCGAKCATFTANSPINTTCNTDTSKLNDILIITKYKCKTEIDELNLKVIHKL